MEKQLKKYFLLLLVLIIQSCATFDKIIEKKEVQPTNLTGTTIFLIGDAGYLDNGQTSKTLLAISENIKNASEKDVLLFLGDNIYPKGFDDNQTKNAQESLDAQLNVAKNFKGKVVFIPGNHDWYSGLEGLKKQEKYIENSIGKDTFLPENGCPIDSYEVSKDIVIITIDSEWYLTNWDKHPKINDNCEIDTREKFWAELKSVINKNQNNTIVLAVHHPLESNGHHGGQFEFSLLKSPINVLRRASGVSPADTNFPLYREFSNKLTTILQEYKDNTIIVSGHEHNLQYLEHQEIPQIISGSGSKVSAVRHYKNQDKTFGYAGLGYAILSLDKNKQQVHYFDENNTNIFSKTIRENKILTLNENYSSTKDSVINASIYEKTKPKSKLYNFFLGNHYRKYYNNDYSYPIVSLDTLFGGLSPIKLGGGNQSISLRLEDKEGKEYVMRQMKKSASQFIQVKAFQEHFYKDKLKNTVAEKFLLDFYTTSYPFATLLVGELSDIVDVYHTNPNFYYVPKQKQLGNYNDILGDNLFLIEERVSKEFKSQKSFGASDDIISTDEVFEKLRKNNKSKINNKQYIKTRLFDMWIGDWDRHEDQYRWATFKNNDGTVSFEPIPRDRDQAFPKFDGFLIGGATRLVPALRLMQSFQDNIRNVNNFNQIIYKVDKVLIIQSTLEEWLEQAKYLQESLTDLEIDNALKKFPNQFKDKEIERIVENLKLRRNHILEWAEIYYKTLNKNVIIEASNNDDTIQIERLLNGFTAIKISSKNSKNSDEGISFEKTFDPKTTKEIWVYGLDGNDLFDVKGNYKSKIKIILAGGQNKDTYTILNKSNIKIYDYKSKENTFEGEKASIKLTDNYDLNNDNFHKFKNNLRQILPAIGFNPDEGFIIGGKAHFTKFGYELNPFTQKHSIGAKYFSATSGYELSYDAEIANVVGNFNLKFESRYTTPAFAQNFFGNGNETKNFEDELDIAYYRTRLEQINTKIALVKKGKLGSEFQISIPFDYIKPNENENRFVDDNLTLNQLDKKYFIGLETGYYFKNKNNNSFSTLGIEFQLKGGWKTNLEEENRNFGYLKTQFHLDYPILKDDKLTLATLWNFDYNNNNNLEFYQTASIGGKNGLRGYRNERFSGQYSYFQNTDLRLNLFDFNAGILPAKFGIFSGFDYGRVWNKNENSNKWHNSVGGGIYINTSGIFTLQSSYFVSEDGGRFVFGLGFGF